MSSPTETHTALLLELAAGPHRAEIAPHVGGALARFEGRAPDGRRVQWLRPASAEGLTQRHPLAMASFPLVPFCNRIRNGQAQFEGRQIAFPPNHPAEDSPHPLHGIGWQQVWTVVQSDGRSASLSLRVPASGAWPWAFSASQRYELDERQLRVTIAMRNEDTAAMPAGIGHHPYFPKTPGTRVTSPTARMWVADDEVLPLGLEVTDAVRKLRAGVDLAELDLDNNFTGWDHHTRIDWPADADGPARSLVMEAQSPLDFFVLYCPPQFDFFCAEPVSQCTDWLNLQSQYPADALGGTRLAPGASIEANFTLTPRWG